MMPDSILFWNAVALEANRVSHSDPDKREQNGPTLSSRALAIVHLAMYDAYAGVAADPVNFPRYLTPPPPPPIGGTGTSRRDAVAGAAHTTLSALFKTQKEFFDGQLGAFNTDDVSFAFGRSIGQALLDLRANDMDSRDAGYKFSMDRLRHRPDPDNPGQGFNAPFYGAQTKGFAIKERHDLDPPPPRGGKDDKYLQALRDVRARGIRPDLTATLPDSLFDDRRTPEETLIGIYWAYDGANRLGTPPRLYNQIIRRVATTIPNPVTKKINGEGENARLFAFVNAAMGDAGILAWEQKYCHDFWRPVLGIREHDETLGPAAPFKDVKVDFNDGDPGWLPLGAPNTNTTDSKNFTPPFPAYPSGHATFGAAAFHVTRMFYGVKPNDKEPDELFPLEVEVEKDGKKVKERNFFVSDELNGGNRDNTGTVRPRHTRFFPGGLWQMIIENATSRVFLGVHWIFDAFDFRQEGDALVPDLDDERIGGVGLGLRIARDIFEHGGGKAPKMTPKDAARPPITTPEPKPGECVPMPVIPCQPAAVGGCADKPKTGDGKPGKGGKGVVQDPFPAGAAEAAQVPAGGQGQVQAPYPSGISQR